jgi:hypothetical protein
MGSFSLLQNNIIFVSGVSFKYFIAWTESLKGFNFTSQSLERYVCFNWVFLNLSLYRNLIINFVRSLLSCLVLFVF